MTQLQQSRQYSAAARYYASIGEVGKALDYLMKSIKVLKQH